MRYAVGDASVFLPQIREVSHLPHENPRDPHPLSFSDRLRLHLQSIYGQYIYYAVWDRDFLNRNPSKNKKGPSTAVGLLAASKTAYWDSCGIYWSTNDFILAHGSYKHSEYYFDNISPRHTALIQSIRINLTIADLTPTIIRHVEHSSRQMHSGMVPSNNDHMEWGYLAIRQLLLIWIDKLQWARKVFNHVDEVAVFYFRNTSDPLLLDGMESANQANNFPLDTSTDLGGLVTSTLLQFHAIICRWVERLGWENFKEVLAGKCEREYKHVACPFHD